MLINALEASPTGSHIAVSAIMEINCMRFAVCNPGELSLAAQSQIFQRSYSTKGNDRGLGTYSMKIFGERYLGGTVGFDSSQTGFTSFWLSLPLVDPENQSQLV